MDKPLPPLTPEEIKQVLAIAWDDRPPFAAVQRSHKLSSAQVMQLLKRELSADAFKAWTARSRPGPVQRAPNARR